MPTNCALATHARSCAAGASPGGARRRDPRMSAHLFLPPGRRCWARARLSCLGRAGWLKRALSLTTIRGLSHAVEPAVLISAVDAICALKSAWLRERSSGCLMLEHTAFRTGALDLLVTAYRSTPELLTVLLRARRNSIDLSGLIRRHRRRGSCAGGRSADLRRAAILEKGLSPREREVYELLIARANEPRDRQAALHRGVDRQGACASHLRQARDAITHGTGGSGDSRARRSGDIGDRAPTSTDSS